MNAHFLRSIRPHPVVVFLVLANVLTMGLLAAANLDILDPARLACRYAAKFGPSLAACVAAIVVWGAPGAKALLRSLMRWRVSIWWYTLAAGGPLALVALAMFIVAATGGSVTRANATPWLVLAAFVKPILLGGGLGEEIGWRGYLLPLLQRRWGPIRASLSVGVCWGLWHSPAFLVTGTGKSGGAGGLVVLTILCVVLSTIFTWVFNASGGRLSVLILLHGCFNGSLDAGDLLFPNAEPDLYVAIALLVIAVTLTATTRLGSPARTPLGDLMDTHAPLN